MIYLPDTNVWIAYLNVRALPVKRKFAEHSASDIGLSTVVKAELLFGAHRSRRRAENLRTLELLFQTFLSVPFDEAAAEHYEIIRSALANQGTPIGPNDLLIASTAVAYNLVVVTHNTREFGRVPGLVVEDWQEDASPKAP